MIVAVVGLLGPAAIGFDGPSGTASPGWHRPADSPAAIGSLPGPDTEPAVLRNQPEIPGLSGRPGGRQRPSPLLALGIGNLGAGSRLSSGRRHTQDRSPLRLSAGGARLRAPPSPA